MTGIASMKVLARQAITLCKRSYHRNSLYEEVARFNHRLPVTQAFTPPGSWYVDSRIFDLEKASVFAQNWLAVPGLCDLSKTGDFITGFLADEPYLISRDGNNELRFFHNICRHHGTLLCDKSKGCTNEFVCPYHAWTYSLEGRLTQAKKLRNIENFSAKDYGLKSLSGTSWLQSLFLNLDRAAPSSLHQRLKSLENMLVESGCTPETMTYLDTKVYPQQCNWKVVIDNYLDGGYHVPICHEALSSLISEKEYSVQVHDGYSVQCGQSVHNDDAYNRVGAGHVIFAHIYPNLFVNRYGHWLDLNYVIPTGPETCDIVFEWYHDAAFLEKVPKHEQNKVIQQNIKDSERVQDEDTTICQRVQKGMRSRSFTSGRYAPRLEHAMHDFHCRLQIDFDKVLEK